MSQTRRGNWKAKLGQHCSRCKLMKTRIARSGDSKISLSYLRPSPRDDFELQRQQQQQPFSVLFLLLFFLFAVVEANEVVKGGFAGYAVAL